MEPGYAQQHQQGGFQINWPDNGSAQNGQATNSLFNNIGGGDDDDDDLYS